MTAYRVFIKHAAPAQSSGGSTSASRNDSFEHVATIDATTGKQAVTAYAEKAGTAASGKTFAVSPDGNWQEFTPKVETKTAVSFS